MVSEFFASFNLDTVRIHIYLVSVKIALKCLHRGRIEREGTLDQLLGTVPARTIVEVVSDDEGSVYGRAADLGLAIRKQGGRLALLFVEETTLEAIVESLSGTGVRSVSLRPVTLEDVYFDATQG